MTHFRTRSRRHHHQHHHHEHHHHHHHYQHQHYQEHYAGIWDGKQQHQPQQQHHSHKRKHDVSTEQHWQQQKLLEHQQQDLKQQQQNKRRRIWDAQLQQQLQPGWQQARNTRPGRNSHASSSASDVASTTAMHSNAAHAASSLQRRHSPHRQPSVAMGALVRGNSRRLSTAGSGKAVVLAAAAAAAAAAAVTARQHAAAATSTSSTTNSSYNIPSSWMQSAPAEVQSYAERLFSRVCLSINMTIESYQGVAALQAASLVLGYKWVLRQEQVHAARVFDRCMRRAGLRGVCELMDAELRVMEAAGWRLWMD